MDLPDADENAPMMMPPLLAEAEREGKSPVEYLLRRKMLGLYLWLVPMRLMPDRMPARFLIGQLMAYEPGSLCDLRARTIDGEIYWVFASPHDPHPEKSPLARIGMVANVSDD